MSFTTLSGLTHAVLEWLGQPNDPLLESHVQDWVRLFECEAQRRLRTKWREVKATLTPALPANPIAPAPADAGTIVTLPLDYHTLRALRLRGNPTVNLSYLPPEQLTAADGPCYTIEGLTLRFASVLDPAAEILITYQTGITPLSPTVISNWLLQNHPDCYLFGVLAEGEGFIMNDERVGPVIARRDAAFASILEEDRHARYGGGKLVIRPDLVFPLRSSGRSSGGSGARGVW